MVSKKEKLEQIVANARQELIKIGNKERSKEASKILGRCYRFRNNYSMPEKPSDYWWLYRRVVRIEKDGTIRCFEFQTDKHGEISVKPEAYHYETVIRGEEISLKEFKEALYALEWGFGLLIARNVRPTRNLKG
jgi:hypothetical protein